MKTQMCINQMTFWEWWIVCSQDGTQLPTWGLRRRLFFLEVEIRNKQVGLSVFLLGTGFIVSLSLFDVIELVLGLYALSIMWAQPMSVWPTKC